MSSEDVSDELSEEVKDERKKIEVRLPTSSKQVFKTFTLSATNQILRGISPTTGGSLSPRYPTPSEREKLIKKELIEKQKNQGWMELIASELYSAKVTVVPPPGEGDVTRVSQDPRRGRYGKKKVHGPPFQHLCKMIRKKLIKDIIHKHNLVSAKPKVDTGLGKKLPTKKQLMHWKKQRARHTEQWRRRKKKRRRKGVISTKRKRLTAVKQCKTCGDYHFRRICGGRYDMKINLMVRQIFQKADVIKQNMGEAWEKLDDLESSYQQMLLRIHRLQSNRVCIGLLTGQDYPGEQHPVNCPCSVQKAKEREDQRRQEERRKIEEQAKRELEEKRETERLRREKIIEMRKKRFYSKMKSERQKSVVRLDSKETIQSSASETDKGPGSIPSGTLSGSIKDTIFDEDITRLDQARFSRKSTIMDDLEGSIDTPPVLGLIKQVIESDESGKYKPSDLIVMDGKVKTLVPQFTEDGGMVRQTVFVDSIPEFEVEKESSIKDSIHEEEEEEEEEDVLDICSRKTTPREESDSHHSRPKSLTPFGDFLDIMEVF